MILLPAYRENRQSHCYLCAEYSVSSLPILMIFIANHLDKSCLRGNETALPDGTTLSSIGAIAATSAIAQ
ncbi:hypothetical protein NIES21_02650 [Anabaenopsis circularis NIES-21]|uniref:Uncharacterized protein n=1 Tax=Anabaenopsis circularis NIES-21 TaxID=1085406 RepID=A0A1Z4GAY5_9CYAN|nr:hypothetical protein NIES21_02650 [Anabaenopsis circularis NIES-21]